MKCLRPDCTRTVYTRGLCANDYRTARRLVLEQRTSWPALEAAGKAKPSQKKFKRRFRPVDWFLEN